MDVRPASTSEIVARNCLTHSAWGTRLSLEQYLEREKRLAAHPFATTNMRTWVLAEDDELFASCETYRMKSILRADEASKSGWTYGVATVFVEADLRRHGYGSRLLKGVLEQLEPTPDIHASILFSDVGTIVYERLGYVARPATNRVYAPASTVSGELVADPVSSHEIKTLIESSPPGARWPAFRVYPSAEQIDWHIERARIYADALDRSLPEAVGARAGEAWGLWAPDFKNERLLILMLAPGLPDGTRAVIEAARRVARNHDLEEIVLWENPDNAELTGGESVERDGSIPMIRPFIEGVDPEEWTDYCRALWV